MFNKPHTRRTTSHITSVSPAKAPTVEPIITPTLGPPSKTGNGDGVVVVVIIAGDAVVDERNPEASVDIKEGAGVVVVVPTTDVPATEVVASTDTVNDDVGHLSLLVHTWL